MLAVTLATYHYPADKAGPDAPWWLLVAGGVLVAVVYLWLFVALYRERKS